MGRSSASFGIWRIERMTPGDVVRVPGARGGCHYVASRLRQQFPRTYSASADARCVRTSRLGPDARLPQSIGGGRAQTRGSTPPRRRRPYRLSDSARSQVNLGGVATLSASARQRQETQRSRKPTRQRGVPHRGTAHGRLHGSRSASFGPRRYPAIRSQVP